MMKNDFKGSPETSVNLIVNVVNLKGIPRWFSIGVGIGIGIEKDRQFKPFEPDADSDTDPEIRGP